MISAILEKRKTVSPKHALLVGISGIDAAGKGYCAVKIAQSLGRQKLNLAVIGADGWLNLPRVRFSRKNSAEHFYEHAFRFDEMLETLVLPLKQDRSIDLSMDYTEETATSYRSHRYHFQQIDVILLEGIFLFKRALRHHFDLACWVECSFPMALARAIKRSQEGLPPRATLRAFERIYFPSQRIHFERDAPRAGADLILPNESEATETVPALCDGA